MNLLFGGKRTVNEIESETGLVMDAMFGPAFRYPVSEKFFVFTGIGLNCIFYINSTDMTLGVGATAGLQYSFSDSIGVIVGSNFAYDFYNLSCSVDNIPFSSIDFAPYIGINFKDIKSR